MASSKLLAVIPLWAGTLAAQAPVPVVVSPEATPVERLAAEELATYLKRLYPNSPFDVRQDPPPQGAYILLGAPKTSARVRQFVPVSRVSAPESFAVTTARQGGRTAGVIAGADARGVLYGVYALLEKLGFGFYLSYNTTPAPRTGPFDFAGWELADRPLAGDRVVFNWHNFLSSCSTWELEDWKLWISQAARMRYNAIMVHAYGNNPMFAFRHNGQTKPVGYLATTAAGRDWGTQHVNDVRRLVGGGLFQTPVFGASVSMADEDRRAPAATALMQEVFAFARSRGLGVTLALDVDTESANPQNIIRTLPEAARITSGNFQLANPDTPEGYAYWKSQAAQLLSTYPQIDRLVVWFRVGATPWRNLKPEGFPGSWKQEWEAELRRRPQLAGDPHGHGMFVMARLVRTFARALRELGRSDVELATGSWRFGFLKAAAALMPPEATIMPLDWEIVFYTPASQELFRAISPGRRVVPIVWAHHDDHTYIGRPYTPFPRFHEMLRGTGSRGFGIIHWTTRPLDLYFKSLAAQVWEKSADRALEEECRQMAARTFGEAAREAGGRYLHAWVTEAPMFGRETSDRFIDRPLPDPQQVQAGVKGRLELLSGLERLPLAAEGKQWVAYYRDFEEFVARFFETHAAWEQAQELRKRGAADQARTIAGGLRPEPVIASYVRMSSRGRISRGEEALIISLNLRWLPYILSLRQAFGFEPVRIKFQPTQHEPLAQGAGRNTFFVDSERRLWRSLGEKETGAAAFELPTEAADEEICGSGLRIEKPLTLNLGPIMGDALEPGSYMAQLLLVDPRGGAAAPGIADIEWRGATTVKDRIAVAQQAAGKGATLRFRYPVKLASGLLEWKIQPAEGTVHACGVALERAGP